MQMIDVLKRLAELDAGNPNVAQPTLESEKSLGTITNISESVNECGGMMGMSNTPASFSINASAASGTEVADMLSQIMGLAGVKKSTDLISPVSTTDKEIELGAPHDVELDGDDNDMAKMIGMIDRLNGPEDSSVEKETPVANMADEVQGMADELADVNDDYDNTPDEKVKAHDYGNTQVTPKPQGLKQRLGDNPYQEVGESIDVVTNDLLSAYEAFKSQH